MKTPDEWHWIHANICFNDPAVHGQMLPAPQHTAFIKRVQDDALATANADLARLTEELENAKAATIHSCGDTCQRPSCVQRREIARLTAENAELREDMADMDWMESDDQCYWVRVKSQPHGNIIYDGRGGLRAAIRAARKGGNTL